MVHLWYQWGDYKPEWSAFLLRRETVHDIGFFDENNWPARHEDYDYTMRMTGSPRRRPWYRHLLPHQSSDDRRCPSLYVHHGLGATAKWQHGTENTTRVPAVADEYLHQQSRRGQSAFSVSYLPSRKICDSSNES